MSVRIPRGSIVVGVDGSDHSDRAVRWAAEQAHLENRPLVALVAAGDPSPAEVGWSGAVAGADPADDHRSLPGVRDLAERATELARAHRPGIDAVACATVGDPRDVLTDLSASAHLLVVGSRGRGAVRSLLLGSVSAALTRSALCPLVVCRPGDVEPSGGVVVGVDGSVESLPVIEFAFQQASLRSLPLTVVHCFWDVVAAAAGFREASGEVLNDPDLEELRIVLAESLAGFREEYPDVKVDLVLRHGLVDEALTRHGSRWDLVVVGRHPVDSLHRTLIGSIGTAVVERAHCPVAIVPEADT